MIQIRSNVFETNSSSTHSITICTEDEFKNWKKNKEIVFDRDDNKIVNISTLSQKIQNTIKDRKKIDKGVIDDSEEGFDDKYDGDEIEDARYLTYKQYSERETSLESFEERYTSPSGDKIVVFGEYGNDY